MPSSPFNILMIAPTSFFSDYGGHIRILEESRALQALGHRVTIVTYYKGNDLPDLTIYRTRKLPWHTEYEVGSSRHKLIFDLYLAHKAWELCRQLRPQIIHGHMHEGALIGSLLARRWHLPLLFDFQGSLSREMVDHHFIPPQGFIYKTVNRVEQFICHQPQAILTSSLRAQEWLTKEFAVPPNRVHPLPDCANTDLFTPQATTPVEKERLRQQWGIPAHRQIIAYLGLLADYQGIDHLIQAAVLLKNYDIHFLIMGFPNVDHYKTVADNMGVADFVTFTGRVDYYHQAPALLSLGDVAVSAKQSMTEGSGKVLNYMALAQPVVAYDTPVHREYLGEWGVYVPAGDVNGLANAILNLCQNPSARAQLGQGLRQRVLAHYSWQVAAQKIEQLYERLTNAQNKV